MLWSRRKLWGTVRRVCTAAFLRPNERLMKKNRKTNERWMFESVASRIEVEGKKERESGDTQSQAFNRGNASLGWLAGGSRFKRHLHPKLFGLRLYFWRSYFVTPSLFLRHRYTRGQHQAKCNIELSIGTEKGFG